MLGLLVTRATRCQLVFFLLLRSHFPGFSQLSVPSRRRGTPALNPWALGGPAALPTVHLVSPPSKR